MVVYPKWPRHWMTLWKNIPVKKTFSISAVARNRGVQLWQAGPRVEKNKRNITQLRWAVMVAVVVWGKLKGKATAQRKALEAVSQRVDA